MEPVCWRGEKIREKQEADGLESCRVDAPLETYINIIPLQKGKAWNKLKLKEEGRQEERERKKILKL